MQISLAVLISSPRGSAAQRHAALPPREARSAAAACWTKPLRGSCRGGLRPALSGALPRTPRGAVRPSTRPRGMPLDPCSHRRRYALVDARLTGWQTDAQPLPSDVLTKPIRGS